MDTPDIHGLLATIRRAEKRARAARAERDRAIREAKDAGVSYGRIAEAAGLTRPGVQAVIRRTPSSGT